MMYSEYFVPAFIFLLGATHQSVSGFVAVQTRRHCAALPTFRPAVGLSSTSDSDSNVVWVKLFIDDSDKDIEAFEIYPIPLNVNRLKDAIHRMIQPELSHCSAASLKVFAPGTDVVDLNTILAYRPGKPCSELPVTTDDLPIIVRAPKTLQQENTGRLKQLQNEEKELNLQHLLTIKMNELWVDCGKEIVFTGRYAFVKSILTSLTSMFDPPPTEYKCGKALVYSSVSGVGKTVSMLQLKAKLPKDFEGIPVVVSYLGFNVAVPLSEKEIDHILRFGDNGAEAVLARRLASATIISMENPYAVTVLPTNELVYDGYEIPPVRKSIDLLLTHTNRMPIYIIAGLDEVQWLNQVGAGTVIPLGRLFLRILRRWQTDLYAEGLRIVPIGTGIAIDWAKEATIGVNRHMHHEDSTLISKPDFHTVVDTVVRGLDDKDFENRFSKETSKETVIDLIAAAYWPRVRLLEWWRDKRDIEQIPDSNEGQWVQWMCYWLMDEAMTIGKNPESIPGKHGKDGRIFCLFELSSDVYRFSVIPDGYSANSIVANLMTRLPVPRLYDGLDVLKSLSPKEFIMQDAYEFEKLGFHTVGAAIHVGLHALRKPEAARITWDSARATQKKRLGLALWFQEKQTMVGKDTGELYVPEILGPVDSTGIFGDYYPFSTSNQTIFVHDVMSRLQKSAHDFTPVYIRCGQRTCCDYLFFYVCCSQNGTANLICNICDAKHTGVGDRTSVSTTDQAKLFTAAVRVDTAVKDVGLVLSNVRLLFVTNKNGLSKQSATSNSTKQLIDATTVARGDGGCGGSTGPVPEPVKLPDTSPDFTCDLPTAANQALIYRLSGDLNPLHADPAVARAAGFPRPILHGMSTFGVCGHALLRTLAAYDPARVRRMDARFTAPVYPGETIRTEIWGRSGTVHFRAKVLERDLVVLGNGLAEIA